jgi:hypothetical protein
VTRSYSCANVLYGIHLSADTSVEFLASGMACSLRRPWYRKAEAAFHLALFLCATYGGNATYFRSLNLTPTATSLKLIVWGTCRKFPFFVSLQHQQHLGTDKEITWITQQNATH